MAFQKFRFNKTTSANSHSSGQAIVEYILILIVTVSLLVGLGTQIFKPMRAFLKSYMGDYTACLLETGELPSFGDPDARAALQTEGCNAQFQAATLTQGRPPISRNSASSSSRSSSSSSSSPSSSSSGDKSGSGSGGGSSTPPRNSSGMQSGSRGLETASASAEKVTEVPLSAEQSAIMNRQGSWGSESVAGAQKKSALGSAGMTDEEKRRQERQQNASRVVASGEGDPRALKKIPIKKPEPKVEEIADEPMTFGDFLKFLLIAAIVIAIIVVLGSQALKIANSDE